MKKYQKTILTFIGVIFLYLCSAPYFNKNIVWYGSGPIQVIEKGTELIIFLQFNHYVARSKKTILSYDIPNMYPIGHFQEIFLFDRSGFKDRIKIKEINNRSGVTFNPGNSIIFEENGNVFLYKIPSMQNLETIFKLTKSMDTFEKMPLGYEIRGSKIGGKTESERIRSIIDKFGKKGEGLPFRDFNFDSKTIKWDIYEIHLSVCDKDDSFTLKIESNINMDGLPIVITYDKKIRKISNGELRRLHRRKEIGYLRP